LISSRGIGFYRASSYASVVLAVVILSVCLSVTCVYFVTKPNNALPILIPHGRRSLQFSDTNSGWWATPTSVWKLSLK